MLCILLDLTKMLLISIVYQRNFTSPSVSQINYKHLVVPKINEDYLNFTKDFIFPLLTKKLHTTSVHRKFHISSAHK
jgi:hypothetical protein